VLPVLGEIGSRSPETPKIEFAMASLLEGAGFEPSVPGREKGASALVKAKRGRVTETTRGRPKTVST